MSQTPESCAPVVGKRAPEFTLSATRGVGTARPVALADFRDRWLILVFYPRDFSLVCPTELTALNVRFEEFRKRGCDLLGISTDTIETHERWIATPRPLGGLGGLEFPLASDTAGSVSRAYGVFLERQHVALRGLFIIDPNGVVQYQAVHNLSVGRRTDEILRILAALESGGMCAEGWCIDCANLDPTAELMPGSMLSHYRIEAEVGRGAFGMVYRARDTILDRVVAVKVFKPGDRGGLTAPIAEARSAAALNHPNVCAIFSVDDSEGVPFIAMEYVDGRPLSDAMQGHALPPNEAARIGRQIALGLAAAHTVGIVHGDLKPANILLSSDGIAKVTDFGLARRAGNPGDEAKTLLWSKKESGGISGTPSYMSPEQSRGDALTPASDLFSFGLLLYEMVTGRVAFVAENVLQVMHLVRNVDPEHYAAELPEPFARIVRESLARQPENRHITMREIAEILG